jgi:hypothetical protein
VIHIDSVRLSDCGLTFDSRDVISSSTAGLLIGLLTVACVTSPLSPFQDTIQPAGIPNVGQSLLRRPGCSEQLGTQLGSPGKLRDAGPMQSAGRRHRVRINGQSGRKRIHPRPYHGRQVNRWLGLPRHHLCDAAQFL